MKELLTDTEREHIGNLAKEFLHLSDIGKEYFGDWLRANSLWTVEKRVVKEDVHVNQR